MRDRLIELLGDYLYAEQIADHLLKNGVIVPPCKVGGTVYQTDGVRIYESTIDEVTYYTNNVVYYTSGIAFDETAIGHSVFLTREEAKQILKGR